jgi:hypothetical protein
MTSLTYIETYPELQKEIMVNLGIKSDDEFRDLLINSEFHEGIIEQWLSDDSLEGYPEIFADLHDAAMYVFECKSVVDQNDFERFQDKKQFRYDTYPRALYGILQNLGIVEKKGEKYILAHAAIDMIKKRKNF